MFSLQCFCGRTSAKLRTDVHSHMSSYYAKRIMAKKIRPRKQVSEVSRDSIVKKAKRDKLLNFESVLELQRDNMVPSKMCCKANCLNAILTTDQIYKKRVALYMSMQHQERRQQLVNEITSFVRVVNRCKPLA
jgi:hypothetical protein